ncbi:AAA domain-containing protein [Hyaloraphidium curvatum]|nr:AAA domain-containing protein [Hyaloraphidium curvatum]
MSDPTADAAVRRLAQVAASLREGPTTLRIGDTSLPVHGAGSAPERVPRDVSVDLGRSDVRAHLAWMAKKEALAQDMFLLGPPGPLRRHLALAFCALARREAEYVVLHRDTSAESDLKQRREITRDERNRPAVVDNDPAVPGAPPPDAFEEAHGGIRLKAEWVDAAAVTAAIEGRVLILEGVEKCELNVLPVLNNLLENREVNLEDGRHLVNPHFYDTLLSSTHHTPESLAALKLVRVHPNFRVIALGLPVPPYRGNPLDPPFRSRFQVRWVDGWGIGASRLGEGRVVRGIGGDGLGAGDGRDGMRKVVYLMETIRFSKKIDEPLSSTGPSGSTLPPFPQISLPTLLHFASLFPADLSGPQHLLSVVERIYPYGALLGGMNRDQTDAWISYLVQFGLAPKDLVPPKSALGPAEPEQAPADDNPTLASVRAVRASQQRAARFSQQAKERAAFDSRVAGMRRRAKRSVYEARAVQGGKGVARVAFAIAGGGEAVLEVPCGPAPVVAPPFSTGAPTVLVPSPDPATPPHVSTPRFRDAVARLVQAHAMGTDACLVGPKGSGKSSALRQFAALCGYGYGATEYIPLYKEMTARDLLQRRGTRRDGSTYWEDERLVECAKEGKLCVLDGVEMLEGGVLASLQRLAQDREMPLPDGGYLISERTAEKIRAETGWTREELLARKVFPVSPAFRIVCVASTPNSAGSGGSRLEETMPWLTEEVVNMFHFVVWGQMERAEEEEIVQAVTGCPAGPMAQLFDFAGRLRYMSDDEGQGNNLSKSAQLSTRQLIRIGRRLAEHEGEDLWRAINRACLGPFLPMAAKQTLEGMLAECSIPKPQGTRRPYVDVDPNVPGGHARRLHIGDISVPVYEIPPSDVEGAALVPRVPTQFFDNDLHTLVMREMAIDFNGGEHLLLIGNQGVGKNRLTDRFLELINRPREYIQLHRDTTVQALMVQPTVENGVIFYKDSPLVRAVKMGRVLVVDEADKAPVYITAVLKSLAENGEMNLTDGRKIRPPGSQSLGRGHERDITVHPDFRLILLANRPGYPFLGNDFYSQIGDVFATHAVDNPDPESELELLAQAAPGILKGRLRRLVSVFGELRQAFDDGLVSYPFSLRELINVVKHMQKYPDEPLDSVLRNVFDFDVMRKEYHELLLDIFDKFDVPKRGLRLGANALEGNATLEDKEQITIAYEGPGPVMEIPPHGGFVDTDADAKHRGGNQFQAGSGGSSTPGQGGRSGTHRMNVSGDVVFQVAEELKQQVSDEIRSAALESARESLLRRLKEMNMSGKEAAQYKDFYDNVRNEVQQLRVVLEGVQAKERERVWLKNQIEGELDDRKLIDGLTGEHAIYKRRGEERPEFGAPQKKPKRLKFLFDLSGSMFRFNGTDGRLTRSLEAAIMIMEALTSLGHKYSYDMIGHSGSSEDVPLVSHEHPPQNEMERLKVVQEMLTHTQYTGSGDNTLPATRKAIQDIAQEDADDHVVVVLSDANLRRYGISTKDFGKILQSDPKVTAVCIFIGTLQDEAQNLVSELPPGKAYIAMQGSDIPRIIREIFASTIVT